MIPSHPLHRPDTAGPLRTGRTGRAHLPHPASRWAVPLLLLAGCSNDPATPDPPAPEPDTAVERFAAHRFVAVGDTVDLQRYGTLLDAGELDTGSALAVDTAAYAASCVAGGTGWVRFRYRDTGEENGVQTLVVTCVDETGPCASLPGLTVDLERFRPGHEPTAADLLADGDRTLYGVCRSTAGIRLQPPPDLPPLMLRVVDAWGSGPYSVAGQELEWLRATPVIGYSGDVQDPSWIATVSRDIQSIEIAADGTVTVEWEPCASSPECPVDGDWVREDDLVVVAFGAPDLLDVIRSQPAGVQRAFAETHAPGAWDALEGVAHTGSDRSAREELVLRVIGALLMDRTVRDFDDRYGLSTAGARIGFGGFWQTRVPVACLPDDHVRCDTAEAILASLEADIVDGWRTAGTSVWWTDFVGYAPDGSLRPLSTPALAAFDGALGLLDLTAPADDGIDRPAALAQAVRALDSVTPAELPLAFAVHWGPMTHVLEPDGFCEAEVCPSAFSRYYHAFEPAIHAILETFTPGRVTGFGIPIFDGAHFDIRSPYETVGGLELNRVAETGFNNPLMGLYSGQ